MFATVFLFSLDVFPKTVLVVDAKPLAVLEVHTGILYASAAVEHLEEGPLRVALAAEQTVYLLDLDRDVDARLYYRPLEEPVLRLRPFC